MTISIDKTAEAAATTVEAVSEPQRRGPVIDSTSVFLGVFALGILAFIIRIAADAMKLI